MIRLNLWFLPRAFLLHGGHGLRPAPGIPCALFHFRGRLAQHLGRNLRREKADTHPLLFESLNKGRTVVRHSQLSSRTSERVAHRAARLLRSGIHIHRRLLREGRRNDRLAQQLWRVVLGPRSSAQLRTRRGRQLSIGLASCARCLTSPLSARTRERGGAQGCLEIDPCKG
jgi:hypothetical protein